MLEQDSNGPKHINFDMNTKIWKFTVFHFTRYGVKKVQKPVPQPEIPFESKREEPVQEARFQEEEKRQGPFKTFGYQSIQQQEQKSLLNKENLALFESKLIEEQQKTLNASPASVQQQMEVETPPAAKRAQLETSIRSQDFV